MKHLFWLHTCASLSGYGGGYAHMLCEHVKYLPWSQSGKIKATDGVGSLHFTHVESHPAMLATLVHGSAGLTFSLRSADLPVRMPLLHGQVSIHQEERVYSPRFHGGQV